MAERWMPMIDYIAQEFDGAPVEIAEVGVFRGEGSLYILEHLNVKTLHLVDPYTYDDPKRPDLAKESIAGARAEAEQRLAPYKDKIQWWHMTSDEAAKLLPRLNAAYIDGDHYKDPVKRDIHNFHNLVLPGGWLGGHDYTFGYLWVNDAPCIIDGEPVRIEVKPAVDEFVAEHGYYLYVAGEPAFPDWWVQKGEESG